MHTGLMWFDNDPQKGLDAKIQIASDYYRQKFGRMPDLCLVNPAMLGNHTVHIIEEHEKQITIRPYTPILPGHLWIGVEEES